VLKESGTWTSVVIDGLPDIAPLSLLTDERANEYFRQKSDQRDVERRRGSKEDLINSVDHGAPKGKSIVVI